MDYQIKEETLINIANVIREKTNSEEKILPTNMAQEIEKVYNTAIQKQYNDFWDDYQNNGDKTNYNFAFGGTGWTENLIKNHKYPIGTEDEGVQGYRMFSHNTSIVDLSQINPIKNHRGEILGYGVLHLENSHYAFQYCSNLERLGKLKLSGYVYASFGEAGKLSVIEELELNPDVSSMNPFSNNSNLTYVKFIGEDLINIDINLNQSNLETTIFMPHGLVPIDDNLDATIEIDEKAGIDTITVQGLLYNPTLKTLIAALKSNVSERTLNLGSNATKLTDEDKAIIVEKGWTLVG